MSTPDQGIFVLIIFQIGTIVGFFISGVIVDYLGWEAAFYIEVTFQFLYLIIKTYKKLLFYKNEEKTDFP